MLVTYTAGESFVSYTMMILISHNIQKYLISERGKKGNSTHLDEDDDVRDDARDRSCSEKKIQRERERERDQFVSARDCSERLAKE